MDELSLEQHVSKTDVAKIYRRGLRSVTRDISKALTHRDEKVLSNWRLKTLDGKVRQGTEVTSEEVETLHSNGMVPTWWGYEPYLEARYGRRDAEFDETPTSNKPPEPDARQQQSPKSHATASKKTTPNLPPLPKDPLEAVEVLKDFSLRLVDDLERERSRYDEVLPVIKNIPDQQKNTMEVLKGLQDTLKNAQFIGLSDDEKKAITSLLSSGNISTAPKAQAGSKSPSEVNEKPNQGTDSAQQETPEKTDVQKAEVIDVNSGQRDHQQPQRSSKKPQQSSTKANRKSSAKKNTPPQQRKKKPTKQKRATSSKQRSNTANKLFPTFSRLFSSKK